MKQVNKEHYDFSRYSYPDRWGSYFYQLKEVLDTKPSSILEVGVGDKVFGSFIKNNTDISYKSLDIASDLNPDIVAPITETGLPPESFDVICAFEVLEHIPFDQFETALKEMSRISKKHIIISLPHFAPPIQFLLKIPLLPKICFALKVPFPKKHIWNGEHYFEIGKKDYPLNRIIESIKKFGTLEKHFVPFENQYHHFFIIRKKHD